jgi:alpha-ribazole phosphatase
MASLFLIRHAEPEITGVLLGQLNPPLSHNGRLQAAHALPSLHVDTVWTSPLRRAVETAQFVHASHVVELEELREIDQGEWTGKTWSEIETHWSDLAAQKTKDWFHVAAPNGESWAGFMNRIRCAWRIVQSGSGTAALIGHQAVNAALKHLIDGSDPLHFTQSYGEVIRLEYS